MKNAKKNLLRLKEDRFCLYGQHMLCAKTERNRQRRHRQNDQRKLDKQKISILEEEIRKLIEQLNSRELQIVNMEMRTKSVTNQRKIQTFAYRRLIIYRRHYDKWSDTRPIPFTEKKYQGHFCSTLDGRLSGY